MLDTDLATIPNREGVLPAILCRKKPGKVQYGLHLPYMPERSIGGVPPFAHVFILTSLGSLKRKKIIPIDPINQAVDRGFCRSDIRPPRREKPNKNRAVIILYPEIRVNFSGFVGQPDLKSLSAPTPPLQKGISRFDQGILADRNATESHLTCNEFFFGPSLTIDPTAYRTREQNDQAGDKRNAPENKRKRGGPPMVMAFHFLAAAQAAD